MTPRIVNECSLSKFSTGDGILQIVRSLLICRLKNIKSNECEKWSEVIGSVIKTTRVKDGGERGALTPDLPLQSFCRYFTYWHPTFAFSFIKPSQILQILPRRCDTHPSASHDHVRRGIWLVTKFAIPLSESSCMYPISSAHTNYFLVILYSFRSLKLSK